MLIGLRMSYSFVCLTKAMAQQHAATIVALHNQIPYQHWLVSDLLADRDERRRFHLKWKLSQAVFSDREIIGVCIAFHDADSRPDSSFLYLHRIVVSPEHRSRGLGSSLVRNSCRTFVAVVSAPEDEVVVQTPVD